MNTTTTTRPAWATTEARRSASAALKADGSAKAHALKALQATGAVAENGAWNVDAPAAKVSIRAMAVALIPTPANLCQDCAKHWSGRVVPAAVLSGEADHMGKPLAVDAAAEWVTMSDADATYWRKVNALGQLLAKVSEDAGRPKATRPGAAANSAGGQSKGKSKAPTAPTTPTAWEPADAASVALATLDAVAQRRADALPVGTVADIRRQAARVVDPGALKPSQIATAIKQARKASLRDDRLIAECRAYLAAVANISAAAQETLAV